MGLTDAMRNSVEGNLTSLILRKGLPVLPNGQINETLVQHGYAYSAWKDSGAESHVKGGFRQHPETRKWEEVSGCEWDTQAFVITKDDLNVDSKGRVTLEASGVSCVCGQYTTTTLRYTAELEQVVKELNSLMLENILSQQASELATA